MACDMDFKQAERLYVGLDAYAAANAYGGK